MESLALKYFFLLTSLVFFCNKVVAQEPNHRVLITEIFADPTPSQGLPEKEYIELYNNSGKVIDLQGFTLEYNRSKVTFPSHQIQPGDYVTVCRRGNGDLFLSFGDVVELRIFSLLNRGTTLILRNKEGELIHKVIYRENWYTDGKDQGYALEMIDFDFPCVGKSNWKSSEANIGGTPAATNSVMQPNPDLSPPTLINTIVTEDSVVLEFNEKLSTSLDQITVSIEGNSIAGVILDETERVLIIKPKNSLKEDQDYTVIIEGLSDCSGNSMGIVSFNLNNIPLAQKGQLALTEVLYDPIFEGKDFIEFQNVSSTVINLRNLHAWNLDRIGEVNDEVLLFSSDFFLEPQALLCLTEDKQQLIDQYGIKGASQIIEVSELPAMPNTEGELYLGTRSLETIDSLVYTESLHNPFLDDTEGVSLSKVGGLWQSTSATLNYATPGYYVSSKEAAYLELIKLAPDIITPDGDMQNDELSLYLNLENKSAALSVWLHDRYGNELEQITNNLSVSAQSQVDWEPPVRLYQAGYYYLYVQLSLSDKVISRKLPFVIGYYN